VVVDDDRFVFVEVLLGHHDDFVVDLAVDPLDSSVFLESDV
jgi:hypothetical protein